ncbi:unnamed protein product [Amoebophrya sp. A120]|nr:unnamed protein product [Amoebophrya sp. A120]|eukprot:GSA120T00010682001.1
MDNFVQAPPGQEAAAGTRSGRTSNYSLLGFYTLGAFSFRLGGSLLTRFCQLSLLQGEKIKLFANSQTVNSLSRIVVLQVAGNVVDYCQGLQLVFFILLDVGLLLLNVALFVTATAGSSAGNGTGQATEYRSFGRDTAPSQFFGIFSTQYDFNALLSAFFSSAAIERATTFLQENLPPATFLLQAVITSWLALGQLLTAAVPATSFALEAEKDQILLQSLDATSQKIVRSLSSTLLAFLLPVLTATNYYSGAISSSRADEKTATSSSRTAADGEHDLQTSKRTSCTKNHDENSGSYSTADSIYLVFVFVHFVGILAKLVVLFKVRARGRGSATSLAKRKNGVASSYSPNGVGHPEETTDTDETTWEKITDEVEVGANSRADPQAQASASSTMRRRKPHGKNTMGDDHENGHGDNLDPTSSNAPSASEEQQEDDVLSRGAPTSSDQSEASSTSAATGDLQTSGDESKSRRHRPVGFFRKFFPRSFLSFVVSPRKLMPFASILKSETVFERARALLMVNTLVTNLFIYPAQTVLLPIFFKHISKELWLQLSTFINFAGMAGPFASNFFLIYFNQFSNAAAGSTTHGSRPLWQGPQLIPVEKKLLDAVFYQAVTNFLLGILLVAAYVLFTYDNDSSATSVTSSSGVALGAAVPTSAVDLSSFLRGDTNFASIAMVVFTVLLAVTWACTVAYNNTFTVYFSTYCTSKEGKEKYGKTLADMLTVWSLGNAIGNYSQGVFLERKFFVMAIYVGCFLPFLLRCLLCWRLPKVWGAVDRRFLGDEDYGDQAGEEEEAESEKDESSSEQVHGQQTSSFKGGEMSKEVRKGSKTR